MGAELEVGCVWLAEIGLALGATGGDGALPHA